MKIKNEDDILSNLFREMPDEQLPFDFRSNLMQRIQSEIIGVQRRKERLLMVSAILASLFMVLIAVFLLVFNFSSDTIDFTRLAVPHLRWPQFMELNPAGIHFCVYVGVLVLVLLIADNRIRHAFLKNKEKQKADN